MPDERGPSDSTPGPAAHWARVKAVFLDALELPASARAAFVQTAAGEDPALRLEVESLLANDAEAGSFCEVPAAALLAGDALAVVPSSPKLAPGARIGDYEIVRFIAVGGMGEVYRARHVLIERDVAIKMVRPDLADDAARRRLLREARHAALLSHPNICTVHDVHVADGVPFIVMAYVDGPPLSEVIRRAVPPLRDAIDYGAQVADALAYAHAHGIIHRDLKSANVVMSAAGQPIVLDFGLARELPDGAVAPSQGSTLTAAGELAGTLSHMAPEVLRGGRADVRTDIWSLGILLYELVTGVLPFRGRTPFETSAAILGESPAPMPRRVPLALRLLIDRCLAKDPDARYQRADAVRDALDRVRRRHGALLVAGLLLSVHRRTIAVAAAAVLLFAVLVAGVVEFRARFNTALSEPVSTLAFLPLGNATGDPRAGYYADGITDALTTELGAAGDMRVLSRASATRAAAGANSSAAVGRALGTDVVVAGRLLTWGKRVVVAVQLVRSADGRAIWSDRFERDGSEVLALEADIVRELTRAMQVTLRPGARDRIAAVRAVSPAVYEEYLKGRYEWNKRTPASLQAAITHYTRATELDPTYAPAHAALADCFNQLGTVLLGGGSPQSLRPRAAAAAMEALRMDPSSAEAHAALGYVLHYDWRFGDSEQEFRRAIQLNPSYSMSRIWYANLLMSRQRMPEALAQVFAARELDPFSLIVNTNVGWVLDRAGRHDDAIAQFERTLALDSNYAQARWRLADALLHVGRTPEAIAEGQRAVALSDSAPLSLLLLASVEARAGQRAAAMRLLRDARARAGTQYLPAASVGGVFAALGEKDSAMVWITKSFAERSNSIVYLAGEIDYPALRRDRRFQALLARVGPE